MLLGAIGISEAREAAEKDRDGGTSKRVSPVVRSGGAAATTGSKVAMNAESSDLNFLTLNFGPPFPTGAATRCT